MTWATDPRIAEAFARLPDYLGAHVRVSLAALALGLALSLPLALLVYRYPRRRALALAATSIVQTIPGLALLALFYPLLLGLANLASRTIGVGFPALGFLPAMLALALYSMLPVLRGAVTGLNGIDPAAAEAARGVGMTPRQALFMVELPLALPVIMAGIRTAAVWVIGTATLATPIGQTSLGNYIFTGLQTQNWVFVLFGCAAAALLALAVDAALALTERGLRARRRTAVAGGAAALAAIVVAALLPGMGRATATYTLAAKPFGEQYILTALMQQRLEAAGLTARRRDGLGSGVIFSALAAGEVDAYVDYSGTLWANEMKRDDTPPRETVLAETAHWLTRQHGIVLLGALGFANAYALAMPRARAEALGIRSIADLAARAPTLSVAGDYEFFGRPEWTALRRAYSLNFREQRQMQAEFMYPAVASGEIDVIAGYTSDGRIAQFDLSLLDDPKQALPPYDAILLVSPKRARDEALLAALRPLVGAIDLKLMQDANLRASRGETPEQVAAWMNRRIRAGVRNP